MLLTDVATTLVGNASSIPSIGPVRVEFIIFALTLIGVALFHKKTMYVALTGLVVVLAFKFIFDPSFNLVHHMVGTAAKEGEWRILLNLIGLLFGFAILARIFEESNIPEILPNVLPDDWKGGLVLLFLVFVLSAFLDNIAAAMIGGTVAMVVFKGKVHIGYLAAIIAASNAGGAGSVIGDTTTTLMWIDGVDYRWVLDAYVASFAGFLIFGIFGSMQQQRFSPIVKDAEIGAKINWWKIFMVAFILVGAISTNVLLDFPALGVWVAILLGSLIWKTPWLELKKAWRGTVFLVSLVTIASMMPVEELPPASWHSAFFLGFISAVFDNIPLTKLCLDQGGYDWGVLAYAVGFGGSMIWFGSSAGVALSNIYPETKDSVKYIKSGWHVALAYVVSFFVMLGIIGWHPHEPHKKSHETDNPAMQYNPSENAPPGGTD